MCYRYRWGAKDHHIWDMFPCPPLHLCSAQGQLFLQMPGQSSLLIYFTLGSSPFHNPLLLRLTMEFAFCHLLKSSKPKTGCTGVSKCPQMPSCFAVRFWIANSLHLGSFLMLLIKYLLYFIQNFRCFQAEGWFQQFRPR